jgi:hypothetical protein
MTGRSARRDERAVSEGTGVAILVGFTVLVTASVGISVLFVDAGSGGDVTANFTFEHRVQQSMVLVSQERGEALPAGELVIEDGSRSVTWAEVSGMPTDQTVNPASPPIQLSEASAWGAPVSRGQTIEVYWVPDEENRTFLDGWTG